MPSRRQALNWFLDTSVGAMCASVALHKGQDQLVEASVLAHSFDRERFTKTTGEGIASADGGVDAARRAFAELRQRRLGLAVSLVVIAAVIVGLWMKLKEIEEGERP